MNKGDAEDLVAGGVGDFFNFIYDGEPEWALLAVRAPMDWVSDTFAEFRRAKKQLRDVPRKNGSNEEVAPLVLVVRIKGNPWAIIFRSLFFVGLEDMDSVAEDARELSQRLTTTALAFVGDDKSDSLGYRFFEKGQPVECLQTEEEDGEESPEEHSLGSKLCIADPESIEEIFAKKGIYLPACYPAADGNCFWVATYGGGEQCD